MWERARQVARFLTRLPLSKPPPFRLRVAHFVPTRLTQTNCARTVSAGLLFKLLRKHPTLARRKVADSAQVIGVARKRATQSNSNTDEHNDDDDEAARLKQGGQQDAGSSCSGTSTTNASTGRTSSAGLGVANSVNKPGSDYNEFGLAVADGPDVFQPAGAAPVPPARLAQNQAQVASEGVYRVPAGAKRRQWQQTVGQPAQPASSYAESGACTNSMMVANRFVIGPSGGASPWQQANHPPTQHYNGWNELQNNSALLDNASDRRPCGQVTSAQQQRHRRQHVAPKSPVAHQPPATISVNGKQLYC